MGVGQEPLPQHRRARVEHDGGFAVAPCRRERSGRATDAGRVTQTLLFPAGRTNIGMAGSLQGAHHILVCAIHYCKKFSLKLRSDSFE
jgi:hypothetical protein